MRPKINPLIIPIVVPEIKYSNAIFQPNMPINKTKATSLINGEDRKSVV